MGEPQIQSSLEKIACADLRIGVLHHPFDWLADFDCDRIEWRLRQNCNFILRGHQHKQKVMIIHNTSGDSVIIPAGSCYDRRLPQNPIYANSYNFVSLDFDSAKGTVFLRRWSDLRTKWIEDIDSCDGGKFEFSLAKAAQSDTALRGIVSIKRKTTDYVFICYVREEEDFVLKLATSLKNLGISIWLDQWDIPIGVDWNRAIDKALYDCSSFLIVLSPLSIESNEVRSELYTALDENKHVIPLLYKPCRIPRQLKLFQHMDFTSCSPNDDTALEQVLKALGKSEVETRLKSDLGYRKKSNERLLVFVSGGGTCRCAMAKAITQKLIKIKI